jgi:hypothetical protein
MDMCILYINAALGRVLRITWPSCGFRLTSPVINYNHFDQMHLKRHDKIWGHHSDVAEDATPLARLNPKDEGTIILQRVRNYLPTDTAFASQNIWKFQRKQYYCCYYYFSIKISLKKRHILATHKIHKYPCFQRFFKKRLYEIRCSFCRPVNLSPVLFLVQMI